MKNINLVSAAAFTLLMSASAWACSSSDDAPVTDASSDGGKADAQNVDQGADDLDGDDAGPSTDTDAGDDGLSIRTGQDFMAYIEGKTFVMDASNVPSHPFGLDDVTNRGSVTTCYQSVTLKFSSGNVERTTVPGTLEGAPNIDDTGTCNRNAPQAPLTMFTKTLSITTGSTDGSCFDMEMKFGPETVVGRVRLTPDKQQLQAELFYEGRAQGITCADGAVGAPTVTMVVGGPFTGNAVQKFQLQR